MKTKQFTSIYSFCVEKKTNQSLALKNCTHSVLITYCIPLRYTLSVRGKRGRDRMTVEFTTTCAYHH